MIQSILLLIILIFLNATFASAEIAVLSMSEVKLRKLSAKGDVRAKKLICLTEQPARFLATIQVAITLAGLLQSAFAAETFAEPLVAVLINVGVSIPESILKTASIVVITIILGYFNLVFGELVPKRLAMKKSESMALGMSRMLYAVAKICAPLVGLLTISTNLMLKLLGIDPNEEEEQVTEEEIKLLLMESKEQGNIQEEEKEIIQNVFEFNDICVEEICTHRREVILLHMEDDEAEWEKVICDNRHTFYPICGNTIDEIISVLDTRDYFRLEKRDRATLMEHAADKPFFVPETMRANVLFKEMKQRRTYFAVLVDEYGGMSGIITLHDLVESLVGTIDDEYDTEAITEIEQINEKEWYIHGSALIREVATEMELELIGEDCDTFSGYICNGIRRIPKDGETFTFKTEQMTIEVLEVKNHTIGRTRVYVNEDMALYESF